jgi:thioredoxin-related protein
MNAYKLADEVESGIYCQEAAAMLRKQAEEIEYWKEKFNTAMELHNNNTKPAKYTDEWWKEVAQFNKELAQSIEKGKLKS